MAETYRNLEEVITRVDMKPGTKGGEYAEVLVAGNKWPDRVFNKDASAAFKAGGPGTYQVTRLPNEKNGKTYWNISAATKSGNTNPVAVKQGEVKQTKTGDDIRMQCCFKGAIELIKTDKIQLADLEEFMLRAESAVLKKPVVPMVEEPAPF